MKEANFSERASFWKRMIEEQGSSGLSRTRFCEMKKISRATFGYWAGKLKRQREPEFLQVLTEPKREPFRVEFKSGAVLHFGVRPDPEFIELLLKLIS